MSGFSQHKHNSDNVTQLPPVLPTEATQHHQTLPQHMNQIVSAPVELPSHIPIEALMHNGGGSMVQQNGGSLVRREAAGRGLAWTQDEHSLSGFPQQYKSYVNNNNYGNSSLSGDEAEWNGFNDLYTAPWQTLDDLWAPNIVTQFPPMLPVDATQHLQTLPITQVPPMLPAAATQHHQTLPITQVRPMLPVAATQHNQTLPIIQVPPMLPAAATQHHQTLPITQFPPMLPAAATQHHQTLPQHMIQIVPAPVEVPSHVPIEAQVQNGGGSKVQQNDGSSVRRKAGRGLAWTKDEHGNFLRWLSICGKGNWKGIAKHIPTKSSTQIASHAQKYYLRQNASPQRKKRKSIHDITLNTVSQQNDPQNSTPHHLEIQQVPKIHQMQEMLPLNPPSNMTRHMSEFEYSANQQAHPDPEIHQMQEFLRPYPHMIDQINKFEYPPNNTSSSNN